MAQDLGKFTFTNKADKAISNSIWDVINSSVNTLAGDDTIIGDRGIYFYKSSLDTGDGNDAITGNGGRGISIMSKDVLINTGKGNDIIFSEENILNIGTISTGNGNDIVTSTRPKHIGIWNDGTIDTGAGNDVVDALTGGGFDGNGTTYLGSGNDELRGFGDGKFYGGTGMDKLLLKKGIYKVNGSNIKSNFQNWDNKYVTMNVNQFEKIGGAKGGLFDFEDGTLTVNSKGLATFA